MFEFMHKYRMPILAVMFLGLIGFGAWGAVQSLFGGPPNDLEGTFRIPGVDEKFEVWTEDYRLAASMFGTDDSAWKRTASGWGVQEDDFELFVWDYLVLSAAAKAAGIIPTEAAVRRRFEMFGGEITDKDWARMPEERIEFERNIMAINQLRSQYTAQDPGGVTYAEILDEYKRQYATVKADMVIFEKKKPEDYKLDLANDEDRKKLEDWFNKNKWVANNHKIEEGVDLEVAYVRLKDQSVDDFKAEFEKKFAAATKDMVVKEEDLQARYNASKFVYQQLSHSSNPDHNHDHDPNKPDPDYEFLKEHLEREIKVARLMRKLYDEVAADGTKFESAAKAYGFSFAKLDAISQNDLADQPDFGSLRLSSLVWEAGVTKLPKDGAEPTDDNYKLGTLFVDASQPSGGLEANVFDDPGVMIGQVRMVAHHPERLPEFKEVMVKIRDEWQKIQARNEINQAPRDFRDAVDDWILALPELKEKVDAAKKTRDESVATEIKNLNLDPEKEEDKERISQARQRHHRTMKIGLADDMKPHYAKAFAAVAKEKGLEIKTFGPISKASGITPQYPEGLSRSERLNRMLRAQNILNSLSGSEVGQMTGQPNDLAGFAVSMLLTEKVEPEASELLLYPQRVRQIASGRRVIPDRTWNYETFKQPTFFSLDAPAVDERVEQRRAAEAKKLRQRQERQRRENERRMKARREALEKANAAKPNTGKIQPTTGGKEDVDEDTAPKPTPDPDKKPGGGN